jgi:hypothetical protein
MLYVDKTGTDLIQKNSLDPLVCSSLLLGNKHRQASCNWFIVAYLPCDVANITFWWNRFVLSSSMTKADQPTGDLKGRSNSTTRATPEGGGSIVRVDPQGNQFSIIIRDKKPCQRQIL